MNSANWSPNYASWSPPIPSGAAAMTAWRELDRRTRRDLLRGIGPHPDPMVACVAVGYARTMLGGGWRTRRRSIVFVLAGTVGALVAAAVAVGLGRSEVSSAIPVAVPALEILWFIVGLTRFRLRLIRMENANAATLLAGEAPAPPPEPRTPQGTPLTVAYDRGTVLRQYGAVMAGMVGGAVALPFLVGWFAVPLLAVCAVAFPLMTYNLIRWVLPLRPVLVMDGGGLALGSGVQTPWSAITEIRVHPLRAGNRPNPQHRVIAFVCADPRVPLASLSGLRRRNARRALTYYGSPLAVASRGLDHTVDQIVAAATALHPVPVRRFGS